MKCSICGEKVVLAPSARERAEKYGGKPSDYTKLFPRHAACEVKSIGELREEAAVRSIVREHELEKAKRTA